MTPSRPRIDPKAGESQRLPRSGQRREGVHRLDGGRPSRPDQPGVAGPAARTRGPAHRLSDGLPLRTRPAPRRGPDGRAQGDEINAVASESGWQEVDFSPVELAVLHLTTELLTTHSVSAELFGQVHTALGSEATVELLLVISRYAGLALMLNALQVDLDETARLPIPPRREPS